MAERRMFAMTIIDSDDFLDMPLSTQALYFHLSMRADDDGFINNPKKIQRTIGATDGDAAMLVAKKFIIPFETGVVVIKHWRINNYLRNDRYHETVYQEEKSRLQVKENRAYSLIENGSEPVGIPMVDQRYTENRIDKNRQDKTSVCIPAPVHAHVHEEETKKPEVSTEGVITLDDHQSAELVMKGFNAIAGVKPCMKLTCQREIAVANLLSEFSANDVQIAFNKIRESDYLTGRASFNGRSFQIYFDWFLDKSNFLKVLEGVYDNSKQLKQSETIKGTNIGMSMTADGTREEYPEQEVTFE